MIVKAHRFCFRIALFGSILFLAASTTALDAQEISLEELPGLRERAVVMNIVSRIVEQDQYVVWNSENTKVTIPGRPVGLTLVGANLVVAVQFTPFLRPAGQHILVALGQIWINNPNEGMQYQTTMQTIPLSFGEQVYFFPLGSLETADEARIEIQLMLNPYSERSSRIQADTSRDEEEEEENENEENEEEIIEENITPP